MFMCMETDEGIRSRGDVSLLRTCAVPVWFNEISQYTQAPMAGSYSRLIEFAGLVGTDLTGWQVLLYQGKPASLGNVVPATCSSET